MPDHPLTNFEIQNKPKFNDVYSGNNLPKIKDGTYVKIFLGYTNLFSPNNYEKNDKIILKCFQ